MPVTRERRYDDKLGYSDRISGYPARVSVSVNQYHSGKDYQREVTESEYDDLAWEKHEFYWSTDDDGVYNQLIHHCDQSQSAYASEYYQNYTISCEGLDQAQGDFPRSFSWNAATNQAFDYYDYGDADEILTDIPDVNSSLSTAIAACIADAKIEKQYEWRKRVYNTYMTIGVSAQILDRRRDHHLLRIQF